MFYLKKYILIEALFAAILDLKELVEMVSISTFVTYSVVTVCVTILR
jgi:hypothetical protein